MSIATTELVLGGARSGKSAYALQQAQTCGLPVKLIVTAQARDAEMAARIALHRAQRPDSWQVVEAPFELPQALDAHAGRGCCIVVDCLTLWLSNVLCERPQKLDAECEALILSVEKASAAASGVLILVSNEVGWGIVPDNALARHFRDEAGRLHQRLARVCEKVNLIVAGLPLALKGRL